MNLNTKAELRGVLERIVNPLKPYYSEGCAALNLGETGAIYERHIITMEAFSRPLWGLAPYWAGGGACPDFEAIYQKGLISGTDPASPEYWGDPLDHDQRLVEMAALGYALMIAPEKVWEPLEPEQRENLAKWLYQINDRKCWPNNWELFAVMVNAGLKKVGAPYDQARVEYAFAQAEDFYVGGGWYTDGRTPSKDYYISFAIHFYCLIYAGVMAEEDPERCALFKERAKLFAQDFIYWFADSGRALPYGRSLTYRFAQCAFWSACVFAGVDAFPLDVMKGIITRHLNDWLEAPIFDHTGVLTIGYRYPNLNMSEHYNAPGSPYWSLKAFAILALPDTHPFWRTEAAAMPALHDVQTLKYGDMVVQRRKDDVTALVSGAANLPGCVQTVEKYSKFAYSTKFGFSVPRSNWYLHEAAADSMLAFETDGRICYRAGVEEFRIEGDTVWSRWSPCRGIVVETTIIPTEEGHIRRHEIQSELECMAYDCGFSVAHGAELDYRESAAGGSAAAENAFSACAVEGKGGEGIIIDVVPNTNLLYPKTRIPAVKYAVKPGRMTIETAVKTK